MLKTDNIVSSATPRLAPELTPSVYGPAKGLRKSVCMIRPETDNAAPAKMAVKAFGKRMACRILCSIGDKSPHGHNQRLPLHISKQQKSTKTALSTINMNAFRFIFSKNAAKLQKINDIRKYVCHFL